jgi:hypothetical protein
VIGGQFDDPGRRYIATQSVSTLEPSHTYTVRAIVTGDFGRIRTPQVDVTLPPPIPLRPSYRVQLAQDGVAKRRSTKVLEIRVTGAPVGAVVVASCASHRLGCPARPTRYKVRRGHPLRFFAGRRFAAGATLTIAVSPPPVDTSTPASGTVETPAERGTRLARRFTRETRTTYHFRRSRPPTRSELCLSTIRKQYPCLQIGASTFGPTVRFVRVRGVPPKASVRYICHGSGCPRRGRTITTAAAGSVEFREFRSRKLKPGALLEILVTRPKTIGSVALIHLRARTSTRRDGCTTVGQGTSFVPVRRCPFG